MHVPFTINVPLTILGSCLLMDCLFQISFDGLFISDNIYFIKLFKIISFRYMHEYLLCNEIFVICDTAHYGTGTVQLCYSPASWVGSTSTLQSYMSGLEVQYTIILVGVQR